jgi:anti-sigma-K factor RskA
MSDHHALGDLLPGFALGILEADEERRVQEHLADCPACREDLAALREVTGSLSLAVRRVEPPAVLEKRIMQRIGASRLNTPPLSSPAARRPHSVRTSPRRSLPAWYRTLGAVAAVLIVALATGNILQLRGIMPRSGPSSAPGLTTATLVGVDGVRDAYGTIVLDPEDNHGVLAVRGLSNLDTAHQYQLWLIKGAERRSGGVFSVNADGYGSLQLSVPKDFTGFRAIGISIEPTGGSPQPTGARVMSGTL